LYSLIGNLTKKNKIHTYFHHHLIKPLLGLLNEGITPHKLALCLVFGIDFGIIPILGVTTTLCLIIAFLLRLNKPAIVLVNFFVYPLQLLLIIPFIKAGEWMFGLGESSLTVSSITNLFHTNWLEAFTVIGIYIVTGTLAWMIIMLPISFIIYYVSRPIFQRFYEKNGN